MHFSILLAVSASLATARAEYKRGHLEEALVAIRDGRIPDSERAAASSLLTDAAIAAQEKKKLELGQNCLDEAFNQDATNARALEMLATWALGDGYAPLARRYAEIWAKTHPEDQRAQEFRQHVLEASQGLAPKPPPPPQSPKRTKSIVLYSTSWCPVCKRARGYLSSLGLPFAEKDIEKDGAAYYEMSDKEKAAGIPHHGVPVLDVYGKVMEGFSARSIDAALKDD